MLDLFKKKFFLEKLYFSAFLSPTEGRSLQQCFGLSLWSDTDPQWRPGLPAPSRGQSWPAHFLLPSTHSCRSHDRVGLRGAGGCRCLGPGPCLCTPPLRRRLAPEQEAGPARSACAPLASFPTCPKLNLKKREKSKAKQKSLAGFSPKLRNWLS